MENATVSLLTLHQLADPYEFYAEQRAIGAVVEGFEGFGVARYREVWSLMRDRRVSHEFPREMLAYALGDGATTDFQVNSLLNREGDDHHRLRKLMNKAFSAPLVRQLRDHICDLVDEMLAPMLDGETRDLVNDFAFPLPSAVIGELLGIDWADRDEVRRRTAAVAPQDRDASDAAITWLRDYMAAVLAGRVADPDGDLFERMLAAEEDDERLTHQEIVDNAMLLFVAGFETTMNLIASGAVALFTNPDEQRKLWSDPSLASRAVEEFLRFDPPVHFSPRVTIAEVEVDGRIIPAGRFLQLWLASANHDECQFPRAAELDISRAPNRHVTFGGGAHVCLGAMLARLEGEVVFRRLAERVATFEPAGVPTRNLSGLGTYASVPVRAIAR